MSRVRALAFGVLVIAALGASGCSDDGDGDFRFSTFRTAGGVISGSGQMTLSVTNNLSGQPIPNATVVDQTTGATAVTDGNGNALLTGLTPNTPTSVTVGASGFDLTSIVGVNANAVNLALNPRSPGAVLGTGTVTGQVSGLNPGDVLNISASFGLQAGSTFNPTTGAYSVNVLANRTLLTSYNRLATGAMQTDDVLVPQIPAVPIGGTVNVAVSYPVALANQNIATFAAPGSALLAGEFGNGTLVTSTLARDLSAGSLRVVFPGRRLNVTGLVPSGTNTASMVMAGPNNFNLQFNVPPGSIQSFLLVGATTTIGGSVRTTERQMMLPNILPLNVPLGSPVGAISPVPNAVALGVTPSVQFNPNGFLNGATGFWTVELRDTVNDNRWFLLVNGDSTTFTLPTLGPALSGLGLSPGNPVSITITGQRYDAVPAFDFNNTDFMASFVEQFAQNRTRVTYIFTP